MAPQVLSAPEEQTVIVGATEGTITCLVTDGIRDMEWKKDGQIIAYSNYTTTDVVDARYTILSSGSLHITNITEQDGGIYSCTVSNPAGSDFKTIEVEARYEVSCELLGEACHYACNGCVYPPAAISSGGQ